MLSQIREQRERKLGKITLEDGKALSRLDFIFSELSSKYDLDTNNLMQLLKKRQRYISIPAEIFKSSLSPLENVVMYLGVQLQLNQTQISNVLNRDHTTIWTTLLNAKNKIKEVEYKEFISHIPEENILVPISVFANRKLSILESLSIYIKDKFELNYHQIALILGRNDRTVWTVVNRARKKLK